MPGIVGIITNGSPDGKTAAIGQMIKCMMHETFYTSGSYTNQRQGLFAGWVSRGGGALADCLPLWNEAKDVCLIFSGEDFFDQCNVDYLRAKGHQFDLEDSSYLVHAYEEFGAKFIEGINGFFSGLIVDNREGKAILFNDRYGLSRIYYHENAKGEVYFASEAKSLLSVLPSLRELNMHSLGEFFSCGCTLQGKTFFSGISVIPGGSAWTFSPGQNVSKDFYFRPSVWEDQVSLNSGDYYEKLKETWVRILPRYLRGKERVAMSLTGGVDGRMIIAWANLLPNSMPCYTFGGMYRDCVDVNIARRVAGICQQPHKVITVGSDFLSQFPAMAERTVYITDGTMDVSGSPDLYVNRLARGIAPIRLTGNYGQEILRSAVAFRPKALVNGLFEPEFAAHVKAGSQTYFGELNEPRLSFVTFKQVPWHHYSRLALELSQLTLRSPYLDNDLVALAFKAPPDQGNTNVLSLRLIAEGNPALGKIATDRGVLYPPVPVMTKLRHLYQEFTFKAEYAYDYGMPQWLTKFDYTFSKIHLEKLFLGRHKFYHFRLWYRDELSQYLKDILLDNSARNRSYINGRRVEEIILMHTKGKGNYTLEIHRLLTVELIQRLLIERN